MNNPSPSQALFLQRMIDEDLCVNVRVNSEEIIKEAMLVNATDFSAVEEPSLVIVKLLYHQGYLAMIGEDSWRSMVIASGVDEVLGGLTEEDLLAPEKPPMFSALDIKGALANYYDSLQPNDGRPPKYLYFDELSEEPTGGRRLDFWVLSCWPSSGFEATTYEIKVSRNDFKSELSDPEKRQFGLSVSNFFYFIAPVGVIMVEEVPDETGLMLLLPTGKLNTVKKAPFREKDEPGWPFFASFARNLFGKGK